VSEYVNWLSTLIESSELQACDDEGLVERARAGDSAAFGELVRRHERAALRVAAVVSGSTSDALDIAQEGFVKAYKNMASYRASGSVRSWMLRIVANEAKNHVRGRVRRLSREDDHAGLQLRVAHGADVSVVEQTEHEELVRALAQLRDADRAVLGCRFVAELSEAETAAVLGVAAGTVKSRTSRALSRLRTELGGGRDGY
jgi:RNA polymerase sigma factor (sigma-70 family)